MPPPSESPPPEPSFLQELKNRKVVRVGLVYVATAFVGLQLADLAVEPLDLPPWTMALLFVVAGIGFPLALILAWAFEVTPEGVKRSEPGLQAEGGVGRWKSGGTVAAVLGILALGGSVGWWVARGVGETPGRAAASPDVAPSSIAVLPFSDMSAAGDMAYFGDGMAEEILNALTAISELQVVGRTSSFSFRGSELNLREIGRTLGVETILEGSVRRAGDRIRVTAQLVRTADQMHLWSETYDRTFSEDVFWIQDDIARQISRRVRGDLDAAGGSVGGTESLEAYDRYLQGREGWARRTEEGILTAIEHFRTAVDLDPGYAEAWAALAEAYAVAYGNGILPDRDATLVPGREAARRALELAPELGAAHRARGLILGNSAPGSGPGPLRESEVAYGRALEANPSDAWARYWRSQTLNMLGRHAEAHREALRAAELDPLALQIRTGLAQHHLAVGDFRGALEEARTVLAIDSTFPSAIYVASLARALGEPDPAAYRILAEADFVGEVAPFSDLIRAVGLAGLGREEEAVDALARTPTYPSGWDAPFRARAREILGDSEGALAELGRLQAPLQGYLLLGWPEGPVRSDPRFRSSLTRLGLVLEP